MQEIVAVKILDNKNCYDYVDIGNKNMPIRKISAISLSG